METLTRKDYLWAGPAIIACLITGVLLIAFWLIMAIPMMIQPKLIPDPRVKITEVMMRRAMRAAAKGMMA